MVRFSCFSTPSLHQKPKKVRHLSDKMHSNLLQKSKDRERKVDFGSPSTNPTSINVEEATTPSSHGDNLKSEYSNGDFHMENNKEFSQTAGIKKGQSLGNILDNERAFSDDEVDTQNKEPISRNISFNFDNQNKEFVSGESLDTHHARRNSLFSIEVLEQFDGNLHSLNEGTFEFHENYDVNSPEKVASNSYNSPQESDEDRKDQEHILNQNYDELNPAEFNVRRIVDWINQIDIENSSGVVGEIGECSCSFSSPERQVEVSVPPIKPDVRSSLGMEMAHNFISSLTATSSSAQMINLGLVFVPVLSAFSGLRVLNLSGNFIVPISAGSLPKGLHMLNLSKNNITTIEGLRDLTRLRVLDLSYNRIVRIGHGLASCSSLKELYLAGNKISEIEGLHRLLKLNILDLRANKISTAKGLGQLAANYASLQSINLQGNPCRENVRDKQLKKYLLTLLPNLIYYNKQGIKTSGTKEIFSRTEHKTPRRGSHGSGLQKLASTHVRSSHATGSRSRNVNLSLMAYQKKAVSLQENSPIRKNRSQSTL